MSILFVSAKEDCPFVPSYPDIKIQKSITTTTYYKLYRFTCNAKNYYKAWQWPLTNISIKHG
jgi:hypothetical protein